MGWGRLDDGFDDHPKVVAILDRDEPAEAGVALALWTLGLSWANRNTRNRKKGTIPGLIPPGVPRRWFGPAARPAAGLLVAHGLWEEHESGGWMVHDFGDYLPTESTREARSEAGKRGAAARWGKRDSAGDAGIAPDSDGNLPSACHDADSSDEASDGSHAPARRGPTPTPTPIPQPTDLPSEALFDATPAASPTEPPEKPKRGPKRATRIPDDFALTDGMAAWAKTEVPSVNAITETAKFIDYWRGTGKPKADWLATWRVWMRNAAERSPNTQPRSSARPGGYQPYRNQPDSAYTEWINQ